MSRARLYALILTLAILAAVAWSGGAGPFRGALGPVETERFQGPLAGTAELRATVRQGAGTLRLSTADTDAAYEAALTHNRGIRVDVSYRDGRLRIADERYWRIATGGMTNDWTITLSRRVPVDLEVSTGAGRGTFDLTGLRGQAGIRAGAGEVVVSFGEGDAALERLELQAGAGRFQATGLGYARARKIEARAGVGEFRLDFAGPGRELTEVEINGGVGRIVLTLPEGAGVRVRARGGLTSRLTLPGFTKRADDEYVNAAWEGAASKIDIQARLGVGEFEVRGR